MKKESTTSAKSAKGGGKTHVFLVVGDDGYRVDQKARELVDRLCPPDQRAFGLETIDGSSEAGDQAVAALKAVVQSLQTVGFFGGLKVVWLKNAACLKGASEEGRTLIAELAKEIARPFPDDQYLLITADTVDRRTALFKAIDAVAEVHVFDVPEQSYLADAAARDLARGLLTDRKVRMEEDAFEIFCERASPDTRTIVQEVEKISLYASGRKSVTVEDITLLVPVTRERPGWDLLDAVGFRNLKQSLRILRQSLYQGQSGIGMLVMLQNRFRELLLMRTAIEKRWIDVQSMGRSFRVNWSSGPDVDAALGGFEKDIRSYPPFRAGNLASQAAKFSTAQLVRYHALSVQAQDQVTGASALSEGLIMEMMLLRMLAVRKN